MTCRWFFSSSLSVPDYHLGLLSVTSILGSFALAQREKLRHKATLAIELGPAQIGFDRRFLDTAATATISLPSHSLTTGHCRRRRGAWSVEHYLFPFGFTGHYSLPSCDCQATGRDCTLSTTSVNRRGPPSMPRAELGTALPTRRESTCYDMLRFPVSPEVWRASFSEQVHIH